jgi:hypothetical protein
MTRQTTISDDAFCLGMANYIDAKLPASFEYCACRDDHASFDHSQRCSVCAAPHRYPRHQRIQQEFYASAIAFGCIVSTHFVALGVKPGSHTKRPDIIVYRTGTGLEKPLLIDFSCVHTPYNQKGEYATNHMVYNKNQKYKGFLDGDVVVEPLIITSRGRLTDKSLKVINLVNSTATKKGFSYEVIRRMKAAVINFEPLRKQSLAARKSTGILLPKTIATCMPCPPGYTMPEENSETEDDPQNVQTHHHDFDFATVDETVDAT